LWDQSFFFFEAPSAYDEKIAQKRWKDEVPAFMASLPELLASQQSWTAEEIKASVSASIEAKGYGFGNILNAFRLALVGGSFGPDLFTIVEIVGKDETISRLKIAVEKLG
jgi:glutamyl-tRNA synthetase